jgi:Protein of unknown function (DUF1580)
MFDIHAEHLLTMREASRLFPGSRQGRPTHVATVYRWAVRGVRNIRLETVRIGGCLYTSREAMQRFAENLTTNGEARSDGPAPPARGKSAAVVDEKLRELGL